MLFNGLVRFVVINLLVTAFSVCNSTRLLLEKNGGVAVIPPDPTFFRIVTPTVQSILRVCP